MSVRLEDLCKTIDVLQNRETIFGPTTISFYMVPLVGFCSFEYLLLCVQYRVYKQNFKVDSERCFYYRYNIHRDQGQHIWLYQISYVDFNKEMGLKSIIDKVSYTQS